ncbi:MAG: hypothetical protein KKB51_19405 [Candidatus Riflebacteria bacterium]|nr:hypothetical protein [Candidatus Riflebacteria bacterium]
MKRIIVACLLALTFFSVTSRLALADEPETAAVGSETVINSDTDLPAITEIGETPKVKFLMKELRVPHCKRGPERCELCRKQDEPRWCLLDVDPPDKEMMQRPVLELILDGERQILVFDVIKSFATEEEARQFLAKAEYPGLTWDK